ncbi:hypothetical protein QBC46DRAFT_339896 [Diplogelasinospora grovesii]|uniref:GRF-type domain-containing protein n=1 Tax=Diplogelasinospora grovesii TaxID=303347 RepID=A0AAN6S6F4_9PEZI|nr:hypothetical protein QBC46DRAFT_339896 [Diplogelasinospora grovesii]
MFTTPRKTRGSGRAYRTPRTPGSGRSTGGAATGGSFENGQWSCNCDPRLPAVRFQVKKGGPNKGKWFYTCQQQREEQCGFFLWEDQAQAREKDSLLQGNTPYNAPYSRDRTGKRSDVTMSIGREAPPLPNLTPTPIPKKKAAQRMFSGVPRAGPQTGYGFDSDTDSDVQELDVLPPSPKLVPAKSTAKRKRVAFEEDERHEKDDRFSIGSTTDLGELDSDEETQLIQLSDMSQDRSQSQNLQTKGKDVYNTPSAQRTHDVSGRAGLPTPVSRNTLLIASEPETGSAKRLKMADGTPVTPTPARTRRDSLGGSQSQDKAGGGRAGADEDYEITAEVLNLLEGQQVADSVRQVVQDRLNTFALRMRGVERGRDMVRTALKTRDAKVAELQARVQTLEDERRISKEKIKQFSSTLGALYDGRHDVGE